MVGFVVGWVGVGLLVVGCGSGDGLVSGLGPALVAVGVVAGLSSSWGGRSGLAGSAVHS